MYTVYTFEYNTPLEMMHTITKQNKLTNSATQLYIEYI